MIIKNMIDEIEFQKLKNEYPDFFKNIPSEIMKVILSEETPSKISEICIKNGVEEEEKIEKIAYQVTLVLLGQLSPEELPKTLEKELNLDSVIAKKIYTEADQTIFSTVKEGLAVLYREEIIPTENSVTVSAKIPEIVVSKKPKTKLKEKIEEKPTLPLKVEVKQDTYRETFE